MKYSDLQPGDMFNTIASRYVKQLDGSAMHVVGKYAGQTVGIHDDSDVIPLFVAKEQASLRSIIEAAEELSSALWLREESTSDSLIPYRIKLENEIEKAKKSFGIS